MVVDPEVVFVASLMKADAPALVASFQCDFTLQANEDATQNMRANLRDLKVLACPFIRDKEDKAVTTVRSQQQGHFSDCFLQVNVLLICNSVYCEVVH